MNEIITIAESTDKKVEAYKKQSISVIKIGNLLDINDKPCNVAEYLILKINASSKSQAEIAKDVGFKNPNMITILNP